MSALAPGAKDNHIRIGDYVTLKYLKRQAYLNAEGIIVLDVDVSSSLKYFEEHLFQIYVQKQYSATNELDQFTDINAVQLEEEVQDKAIKNHFEALLKGKENERILNKNVNRNMTGNIVSFGDTIQLLHVKSKKFITILPNDLARDERENMKVSLDSDGSILSWIKLMPRYKINREGENITNNTEVFLKLAERSNECLHCADRPPPTGKHREVNSSIESPTPWRITVFQRCDDIADTSLLLCGQPVYIRDPETQCVLAEIDHPVLIDKKVELRSRGKQAAKSMQHVKSDTALDKLALEKLTGGNKNAVDGTTSATSAAGEEDSDDESVNSIDEFIDEHGEIVFKPMDEEHIEVSAIWVLESRFIVKGEAIRVAIEQVHLRHFASGKYLAYRKREDTMSQVRHNILLYSLILHYILLYSLIRHCTLLHVTVNHYKPPPTTTN